MTAVEPTKRVDLGVARTGTGPIIREMVVRKLVRAAASFLRIAPARGAPGATTTGACWERRWALPLLVAHEIGYARVLELGLWQLLL